MTLPKTVISQKHLEVNQELYRELSNKLIMTTPTGNTRTTISCLSIIYEIVYHDNLLLREELAKLKSNETRTQS